MKTEPRIKYGYRPPEESPSSGLFGSLVVAAIMLAIVIYVTRR